MKAWVLLALIALLLSPLSNASNTPDQQDAIKKLQDAVSKTNIFDLPHFQLKAALQIVNAGKHLDGSYRLLWNGPDKWREEINFPGYSELQVGSKGTDWIQRSTDFIPLRIYQVHAALGFGPVAGEPGEYLGSLVQSGLSSNDKIKKLRSRKESDQKLSCVEIEDELKSSAEICVNDSTGTLFRGPSYVANDFQSVGPKVFPRFLAYVENGKPVAKINVQEFIASDQFPADAFLPPTGVSGEPGCINPTPLRRVQGRNPEYPSHARNERLEGTVTMDVWVGTDGVPIIRKVLASPHPLLERSSLDAIAGWRFKPAACEGKPVRVETILQFTYSVSP